MSPKKSASEAEAAAVADPHGSLADKQIAVRAAAARQLARTGTFDDVEGLIGIAVDDKSPSVRLYAAAAAVAILMRGRSVYGGTPWSPAQRDRVLSAVAATDPARTPSLLLCYAAFPEPEVIKRLVRMLRDPRYGVRAGAAAALRRMALSGAATLDPTADTNLREWVGEALDHKKLPNDAAIELIHLVGEAGWDVLLPRVRKVAARAPQASEAAEQASARCAARDDPDAWRGVWLDEGRDVLDEKDPSESDDRDWFALGGALSPEGGRLSTHGRVFRRIWAPRPADEGRHAAIQADGRTWWRLEGKRLVEFVVSMDTALVEAEVDVDLVSRFLEAEEGAAAVRARALVLARYGRGEAALNVLEKPLSAKKPRNDLHFIEGLARAAMGDAAGAKQAWTRYLDKAKKNDPWREEAESLVG
jgi:hypothetical protein